MSLRQLAADVVVLRAVGGGPDESEDRLSRDWFRDSITWSLGGELGTP